MGAGVGLAGVHVDDTHTHLEGGQALRDVKQVHGGFGQEHGGVGGGAGPLQIVQRGQSLQLPHTAQLQLLPTMCADQTEWAIFDAVKSSPGVAIAEWAFESGACRVRRNFGRQAAQNQEKEKCPKHLNTYLAKLEFEKTGG